MVLPMGLSLPKNSRARLVPRTTTRAAPVRSASVMKRPRSTWKNVIGEYAGVTPMTSRVFSIEP
jgi:hypothetical protein